MNKNVTPNLDNEILNLYHQANINSKVINYKFNLNEEIFNNIWYNYNLNITPNQASKITKSFQDINCILNERNNTLYNSTSSIFNHFNKDFLKKFKDKNNLFILILVIYIILVITTPKG